MRVGVISDTHGRMHPRVREVFAGVDHILHAGDIGSSAVLEELRAIAPVTAVVGNVDGFRCGDAGELARVTIDGLQFFLIHILGRTSKPAAEYVAAMSEEPADVVIFGHSHLPHDEQRDGRWFFNPASAGPRRFDYPIAVGMFELKRSRWTARHIALDERSEAALAKYMNRMA